jgi:circadian clock protein KaiC
MFEREYGSDMANDTGFSGHDNSGPSAAADRPIRKKATGIIGFDEMTGGGLPEGRMTTVIGAPGAGKTVFALQTLFNRLKTYGEACIFLSFEEPVDRIRANVASFDWEFATLSEPKFRFIDARVPVDVVTSGAFDLSGLLAGVGALREEIGAANVVFDGISMLFSLLSDERLERQELMRLDAWVRDAKVTALTTAKSFGLDEREQHRAGFLTYLTDCLLILTETATATVASRALRVAKYRGSGFAANPAPIVIGSSGIEVVGFKSARLDYPTFSDRLSSGVDRLDALLSGGYLRGASILVSGSPGTSKTSLAAAFIAAACASGQKALFVSFDESGPQVVANMLSIGIDLKPHLDSGLLMMASLLSGGCSPEEHYVTIRGLIRSHAPECLVIDPISALMKAEYPFSEIICESLLDLAKWSGVTVLCTSLLAQVAGNVELSVSHVSTIADTWIHVSYVAREGERNRALTIVKSRGTEHSNQVRELVLSEKGIDLVDVYIAEGEVLMGSARAQKETENRRLAAIEGFEAKRRALEIEGQLAELKARVNEATLELELKQREAELLGIFENERMIIERAAAAARLDLRRADDDKVAVIKTNPRARPS